MKTTNKYLQERISILFVMGFIFFFVCEFWYKYNWLGVNQIMFVRGGEPYSLGEMIIGCDNFLLLFFMTWAVKKSTPDITYMRYLSTFAIDLFFIGLCYVFIVNPFVDNWNLWMLLLVCASFFAIQLLLDRYYPPFRKFKLF